MLEVKRVLSLFAICCFAVSTTTFAEQKVAYKCYLDTSIGKKLVYFHWRESKVRKRLSNLVATKIPVENGKRVYVRNVLECTKANLTFLNTEASKIDATLEG